MADFDWLLKMPEKPHGLPTHFALVDFFVLCDLEPGTDWKTLANEWGSRQTPVFAFSASGTWEKPEVSVWRIP